MLSHFLIQQGGEVYSGEDEPGMSRNQPRESLVQRRHTGRLAEFSKQRVSFVRGNWPRRRSVDCLVQSQQRWASLACTATSKGTTTSSHQNTLAGCGLGQVRDRQSRHPPREVRIEGTWLPSLAH